MHARELREMDTHAILDLVEAKRKEMYLRRLDFAANKLEDTNELRKLRKDLARMLTILRERQLAAEFVAQAGPEAQLAEPKVEEVAKPVEEAEPVTSEVPTETESEGEADNA